MGVSLQVRAAARVAVVDDDVVGHVQLNRSWVDARERLVDVLVLSPLVAAVAAADELGAPAVFLEGDPAFYSRRGFVAAGDLGFGRPSVRIPEPTFQVRLLAGHEPWMTGALVYCEPYWAHDCVGLRDPAPAPGSQDMSPYPGAPAARHLARDGAGWADTS